MNYLGRYRIINDRFDKEPYLERYYLFLKDRTTFPFNIFLHKFLKSDEEDLHDHPWDFISIILWGGYWEYFYDNQNDYVFEDDLSKDNLRLVRKWRGMFSIAYSNAEKLHRVQLDKENGKDKTCWTIFIPLRQIREWGFLGKEGWINNTKYKKD